MGLFQTLIVAWAPWSWWVFGLVLIGLEIVVPGTVFLWFGVGALVVGAAGLALPMAWTTQILVWLVLSCAALVVSRLYFRGTTLSEDPLLNDRAGRYRGRVFTLAEPIREGAGRINIDDTVWRVTGPDLPAGTRVRVAGADAGVLRVEAEAG